MFKFIDIKNKGFTIIELIISIFILQFAVIGVFNVFSIITILTSDSADRLTGAYLAQEGMEIVKNIRDTNWLNIEAGNPSDATWVDDLTVDGRVGHRPDCTLPSLGCEADYTTGSSILIPFAMSPWAGRYLDADVNGFYRYTGVVCPGDPSCTKFKRKIVITPIVDVDGLSNHIIKVETYVAWDKKANVINPSGATANYGLSHCSAAGVDNCIVAVEILYNWY